MNENILELDHDRYLSRLINHLSRRVGGSTSFSCARFHPRVTQLSIIIYIQQIFFAVYARRSHCRL